MRPVRKIIAGFRIAAAAGLGCAALSMAATSPLHAAAIVGGTSLLSGADADRIEGWLGGGSVTLTNIYTKTAGDTAVEFHAAVDLMGPTITVIEVTQGYNFHNGGVVPGPYQGGRQVVGGYASLSWDFSLGTFGYSPLIADRDGILFNLTQGLVKEQVDGYQIYNGTLTNNLLTTGGPAFGVDDLVVGDTLDIGYAQTWAYCDPGSVAKPGTCVQNQFNILDEAYFTGFAVGAIEVFTVAATPIAEPAAAALFGLGLVVLTSLRWRSAPRATG